MFSLLLTVVTLLIVGVSMGLCIWLGTRRGLFNGAMRLGFFLVSGAVSFGLALLLAGPIGEGVFDIIAPLLGAEITDAVSSGSLRDMVVNISGGLTAPIVFLVLFFVIDKLTFFAYVPLKKKFKDNEKLHNIPHDKIFGAVLGFVLAFGITISCLVPVGYVKLTADTVDEVLSVSAITEGMSEDEQEMLEDVFEPISDSAILDIDYALSGWLFRGLTARARPVLDMIAPTIQVIDVLSRDSIDIDDLADVLKDIPPESLDVMASALKEEVNELLNNYSDEMSGNEKRIVKVVMNTLEDAIDDLKKLDKRAYAKEMEAIAAVIASANNVSDTFDVSPLEALLKTDVLQESILSNKRSIKREFAEMVAEFSNAEKLEIASTIRRYADEDDVEDWYYIFDIQSAVLY